MTVNKICKGQVVSNEGTPQIKLRTTRIVVRLYSTVLAGDNSRTIVQGKPILISKLKRRWYFNLCDY